MATVNFRQDMKAAIAEDPENPEDQDPDSTGLNNEDPNIMKAKQNGQAKMTGKQRTEQVWDRIKRSNS